MGDTYCPIVLMPAHVLYESVGDRQQYVGLNDMRFYHSDLDGTALSLTIKEGALNGWFDYVICEAAPVLKPLPSLPIVTDPRPANNLYFVFYDKGHKICTGTRADSDFFELQTCVFHESVPGACAGLLITPDGNAIPKGNVAVDDT